MIRARVRVRFRGRFSYRCQIIIDIWLPVHDSRDRVPVAGARYTTREQTFSHAFHRSSNRLLEVACLCRTLKSQTEPLPFRAPMMKSRVRSCVLQVLVQCAAEYHLQRNRNSTF